MQYGTFTCKDFRDDCEQFQATGVESEDADRFHDGCTFGFPDYLPPFGEELPTCPYCGGPSILLERLVVTAG